ncbi:putative bifunctional diguanylate cyclase/phosphodiesterase [Qipengyuania spongiae]|uniref:EAL domain-containing protein n=1 Tax=Qipengyuania spongiae TaxID=2909673 RepID=A0ABY5T0A2_9SPHN|nr:GGDEF and EAL domain-containing protein [Qipengyuania spongiae]UVI38359.1 EAL domain-containing protein [Qipengyuania spongiae]
MLGLKDPEHGDWSRVHGPQYALLHHRASARAVLNLAGTALMAISFGGSLPGFLIAAWSIGLVAITAYMFRLENSFASLDVRGFSRAEQRRHMLAAVAKGVLWAVPGTFFLRYVDPTIHGVAWAYVAALMLGSTVSRYSAPLGALGFTGIAGLGWTVGLAMHGSFALAIIAVLSTAFTTLGAIESAKGAYSERLARLGMAEKSQVVSLLLREYEDSAADWLFQLDAGRRLQKVSPRLAFALGRELGDIEGKSFLELISGPAWETGHFPQSLHDLANKFKERENFSNMTVEVSINGERRWWELSGTPMTDEKGNYTGYRGVGSDVTAQRESSERIAYLARYDTLTALPNRLMLHETLAEALAYAEKWRSRCAFLMLDLDRFKAVNDSLGHMIGDQMLAEVATRLGSIMTENEICGRLGGDEFGIVIRDASDRKRIERVARAVIESLSAPYHIENHILYVGASVGSAIGPRDGRTVEELMRNADLSLYRAKDLGGGEHCSYEPSLHASAEERRQLEFALRSALAKNELLLNYQPVVDANSERIVSFEALVRWVSEEHGFVSPGKFIPLAEDTRLIVPIGKWVMQQACAEAARNWPEHVKVNVNVSPEQLIEPDFVATVVQALSRSGLAPKRLEIEVTESIFMRDADVAGRALEQCMALGCSVALDDFGTGYSSLGYLRKLKFSTIKVDRTFVQGASQKSAESVAIIRAVVAMADSLGMSTTAEGVETADEAEMIRNMGCTKIQGFHFGRPMSAGDAMALFRAADRRRIA